MGVFMYGGGFCRIFPQVDLICVKCGLNVTIPIHEIALVESYGISATLEDLLEIKTWLTDLFDRRQDEPKPPQILYAESITDDPIKAINETVQWEKELPFTITDMETFESMNGK